MKTFALLFCAVFSFVLHVFAAPAGDVIELHSCELYTGGCTASGQVTLLGRSLLRAWHFESGENLAGLSVAALEIADENLATRNAKAKAAVVYLPKNVTREQQNALREWLADQGVKPVAEKLAAINFAREGDKVSLAIDDKINVRTRALEHCDTGGCGEALWYSPRSRVQNFTVVVNDESRVREPALKLEWRDHAQRSVFLGHFDGAKNDATFSLASIE